MSAMQKTPWGDMPIAPRGPAVEAADLVALPENAALLLALVASCQRRAPERVLADAVAFYAEHKIGLAGLADHDEFLRGRAAVARQPQSNEVACSSRPPAIDTTQESEPGRQEVPSGLLPMPHAPP